MMKSPARADTPWHVLTVESGRELKTAERLADRDCDAEVPIVRSIAVTRGRKISSRRALLPGYVFLRPPRTSWRRVLSTPGVIDVLRWGDRPAVVPEISMHALRIVAAVEGGIYAISRRGQRGYRKREKVRGLGRPGETPLTTNLRYFMRDLEDASEPERDALLLKVLGLAS